MSWVKIQLLTTYGAMDAIAYILEQYNIAGIEIEEINKEKLSAPFQNDDIRLIFYLPSKDAASEKLDHIKADIMNLETFNINIGSANLSKQSIKDDWMSAWKKHYHPIKVSNQIKIVPTWEKANVRADSGIIIELDPGLAFGTGSHATTMLSLRALEKYVTTDQLVIDVGSGSGILSIGALLLGASKVIAIDNDQQAIKSTQRNAALNEIEQSLTIKQGNLLKDIEVTADLIVANILAEVIVKFIADAYHQLRKDGYFITSGIIERKKQTVINQLEKSEFKIREIIEEDGWICIIAQK